MRFVMQMLLCTVGCHRFFFAPLPPEQPARLEIRDYCRQHVCKDWEGAVDMLDGSTAKTRHVGHCDNLRYVERMDSAVVETEYFDAFGYLVAAEVRAGQGEAPRYFGATPTCQAVIDRELPPPSLADRDPV